MNRITPYIFIFISVLYLIAFIVSKDYNGFFFVIFGGIAGWGIGTVINNSREK
jgi:hypothetical protein